MTLASYGHEVENQNDKIEVYLNSIHSFNFDSNVFFCQYEIHFSWPKLIFGSNDLLIFPNVKCRVSVFLYAFQFYDKTEMLQI